MDFVLALVLTARWMQQPPRPPSPPVVRVQKHRPKRKRVRRVVHRKPKTVYVLPDIVQPMSQAEGERALRWADWVTWF